MSAATFWIVTLYSAAPYRNPLTVQLFGSPYTSCNIGARCCKTLHDASCYKMSHMLRIKIMCKKSQNQKNKTDDITSHYSVFIVLADNIVWYNSFCLGSWINLGQCLILVEARPDIYCLKLQKTMSQFRQNQQTLGQDWKTNEWRRAFVCKTVKYYYAGFMFHLHGVHYSNI